MCKKIPHKRLLNRWGNWVCLGVGIGFALIFAEGSLRLVALINPSGPTYPFFYAYDPFVGVILAPDEQGIYRQEGEAEISINSRGFRDRDHTLEKPDNTFRIAILGDSYAEAMQVPLEKTFWAKLEKTLNKSDCFTEKTIEVLNFGVSGYGTAQELLMWRHYAQAYAPDLVLLAFFTGNDIRNNSKTLEPRKNRPFFVLDHGRLQLDMSFTGNTTYQIKTRVIWPIFRTSPLLQFLLHAKETLQQSWKTLNNKPDELSGETGLNAAIYTELQSPAWEDAWRVTEAMLRQLRQEVHQAHARLVVVILSNGIQVHPDPRLRKRFQDKIGVQDLFYPDERIRAFGDRHRLEVLALAPFFRQYAEEHQVFLHGFENIVPGTGHWNAAGHALAAEVITEYLCAETEPVP